MHRDKSSKTLTLDAHECRNAENVSTADGILLEYGRVSGQYSFNDMFLRKNMKIIMEREAEIRRKLGIQDSDRISRILHVPVDAIPRVVLIDKIIKP